MSSSVRKVVFPVAGMGSRFLPATKSIPKEMLPVVDRPLIQYAVDEAVAAGVQDLVFVTHSSKRSIEDHFDKHYELESELLLRGKHAALTDLQSLLPQGSSCIYVRQQEALGLGHAVLCAKPVVGDEPFAVILADDLIDGEVGCLQQMMAVYEECQATVLGVEEVPADEVDRYGIVELKSQNGRVGEVSAIIEKPSVEQAPSNLAVVGRYILSPRIFALLEKTPKGAGGEIQLTDAIAMLLKEEPVYTYQFKGKRYDCGNKLGYLKANVAYGLKHPELQESFAQYINTLDI
jgi:UTP--glucose-1-phosphate uridylyltransferase